MSLLLRFKEGLAKTRARTISRIEGIFGRGHIDDQVLEELEDALLEADIGVDTVDELIEKLRENYSGRKRGEDFDPLKILKSQLVSQLTDCGLPARQERFSQKPWVILLVGVNGSGKTTTSGKLAHYYGREGKTSVIAAADTFRAAGIEQVEIWAKMGNARLVKQKSGADPAAVAFDAHQSALSRGEDLLIVDTAGRLQAKRNLMEELGKISRVLRKKDPTAPHEVLLVLDATTGQNGLAQARGFTAAAGGTGIIVTKLDGTARGGVIFPIRKELGLPVEFVGLGEGLEDLQPFEPKLFVDAIMEM